MKAAVLYETKNPLVVEDVDIGGLLEVDRLVAPGQEAFEQGLALGLVDLAAERGEGDAATASRRQSVLLPGVGVTVVAGRLILQKQSP